MQPHWLGTLPISAVDHIGPQTLEAAKHWLAGVFAEMLDDGIDAVLNDLRSVGNDMVMVPAMQVGVFLHPKAKLRPSEPGCDYITIPIESDRDPDNEGEGHGN